ncbi:MAG TPA: CxxxxCH/CxxCH domain-containing protein, partial [Anaeromyxobacteraceae bacterium]|nr:CxxxxCH/CxxCH domain-containing protein [Anaeromyxobacteraceae bacterium]
MVTVPAGGSSAGGSVTVSLQLCTTCHGQLGRSSENADPLVASAPPAGTHGEANASAAAVGAHQAHLTAGGLAGPMACSSCHEIPATTQHPTQVIYFSGLAVLRPPSSSTAAAYADGKCSNVYCHGSFKNGTLANAPSWTGGPAQAACGSCHAVSATNGPGGTHPTVTGQACALCHPGYTSSSVNAATHIDGKIDYAGSCTACHGDPPTPATLPPGVTAQSVHPLNNQCSLCHLGYTDNDGTQQTTGPGHLNGVVEYVLPLTCTTCHGDSTRTGTDANGQAFAPAPPTDQTGAGGTTVVGAHLAHLVSPSFSLRVACAECHVIPAADLHANGAENVAFGALSRTVLPGDTRTVTPAFTGGATPTCSNTYCHGNFKNGNAANAPAWNGTSAACGSCHTLPPAGTHPVTSAACDSCHPALSGGLPDPLTHLNGVVDLPNMSCSSCHGTAGRARVAGADTDVPFAPPVGTKGETLTTTKAVGAHLSHVNMASSSLRQTPVGCAECHVVPSSLSHANGTVNMTFGALAKTAWSGQPAITPAYDTVNNTCASTYCHGAFKNGKSATAQWKGTFGATTTLDCNACHGAGTGAAATPPGGSHPNRTDCGACHSGYTGTTVNLALHMNGVLDVSNLTCFTCHGDASGTRGPVASATTLDAQGNNLVIASPPVDTTGSSSSAAVGTHLAHLNQGDAAAPGALSNALACANCHVVPTVTTHSNGTVAVTFGVLATTGGAAPAAYNFSTHTCASTYCHGQFVGGKGASAIVWSAAGKLGCNACHNSPPVPAAASGGVPASYHPNNPTCTSCHPAGYSATTVAASTHVDGVVTLNANRTGCVACHGTPGLVANDPATADPNVAASPPADSKGLSANTGLGVGAHQPHVNHAVAGRLSNAIHCTECHGPDKTDRTHADGNSAPIFGTVAKTGGVSPTYSAGTCASTYCHGNFVGGVNASPVWNAPGQLGCNACHGQGSGASAQPPGPVSATVHHPQNLNCVACHPGYTATTVNVAAHVDGVVQKPVGCTACHGDLSVVNAANTDVRSAPGGDANAVDSKGDLATATGLRGVGAHAVHLLGTTWRAAPIACNECHVVPATNDVAHATGTPVVTFGALSKTAWSGQPAITPVWNGANNGPTLTCASVYCHGAFKNGANATLTWTAPGTVACGTCHAVSATNGPGGTHPTITAGQNCGTCHGGTYTNTSIDPALHMNGVVDGGGEPSTASASNLCGGCHGNIFAGMNGGAAAVTRHTLGAVSGTNDASTDTAATWPTGGGLAGVAAANRSCVNMCHDDHPHTLASPVTATHDNNVYVDASTTSLRAAGSSTSSDKDNTDFVNTGNGGLCLSCHRSPIETAAPVLHPAVSQAAFNASKHNFTSNAQGTWAYQLHDASVFTRNCTKCHASNAEGNTPTFSASGGIQGPHYSPNPSLLAGPTNPGATTNTGLPASGFVCYNCHGSAAAPANGAQGNRSGKDVLAATQKAYFHPVNLDSKHNTGTEEVTSSGYNSGALSGTNRHASCMDCHDSHQAGGTLVNRAATATSTRNQIPAGSPLTGASGVGFTPPAAAWTATAAGNFAFKATATAEYEVCFKCHTSYAFGATPPTATAATGGSGQVETDV